MNVVNLIWMVAGKPFKVKWLYKEADEQKKSNMQKDWDLQCTGEGTTIAAGSDGKNSLHNMLIYPY